MHLNKFSLRKNLNCVLIKVSMSKLMSPGVEPLLVLAPGKLPPERLPLPLVLLDDGEELRQLLVDGHRDLHQPLAPRHHPLLLGHLARRRRVERGEGLLLRQLEGSVDQRGQGLGLAQRAQQDLGCCPRLASTGATGLKTSLK